MFEDKFHEQTKNQKENFADVNNILKTMSSRVQK